MLAFVLGVVGVPPFVFAVALGRDPVRAAAWGAILGMALIACMLVMRSAPTMITGAQIIAARALLKMHQATLARRAGISVIPYRPSSGRGAIP